MDFKFYSVALRDDVANFDKFSINDFATFSSTGGMSSLAFSPDPIVTVKNSIADYVKQFTFFSSDSNVSRFDILQLGKTINTLLNGIILCFDLVDGFFSVSSRYSINSDISFLSSSDFSAIVKAALDFDASVVEFGKQMSNSENKNKGDVK